MFGRTSPAPMVGTTSLGVRAGALGDNGGVYELQEIEGVASAQLGHGVAIGVSNAQFE